MLIFVGRGTSQVHCELPYPTENRVQIEDLWQFKIENTSNTVLNIFLNLKLSVDDTLILESSAETQLSEGVTLINAHQLENVEYFFYKSSKSVNASKEVINIPGNYLINLTIYDQYSQEMISFSSQQFSILVKDETVVAEKKIKHSTKKIKKSASKDELNSYFTIVGGISNGINILNNNEKGYYYNILTNTDLKIGGIPLDLSMNYNSVNLSGKSVFELIGVHFDTRRYADILNRSVMDEMNERTASAGKILANRNQIIKSKEKIDFALNSPVLRRDVERFNKTKEIEKILADTTVRLNPVEKDSMMLVLKKTSDSIGNKRQLENLISRQASLDKQIEGFNKNLKEIDDLKIGNLVDKKGLKTKLKQFGKWRKIDDALFAIQQFKLGQCFVNYGEFTLKNFSLSGCNVELNPNKLYLAGAIGYARERRIDRNFKWSTMSSFTTGLGIGYGKKENSHIHIYYINSKGNDSLRYSEHSTDGNVASIESAFQSQNGCLTIGAEIAISWWRKPLRDDESIVFLGDSVCQKQGIVSGFIKKNLDRKNIFDIGQAHKIFVAASLFNGTMNLLSSRTSVASNFESVGAPYLIRGNDIYEFKASQKFFGKRLQIIALVVMR